MKRVTHRGGLRRYLPFPKFSTRIQLLIKIVDYNKEEIQGTFYEQELQKTNQEMFRIERVIRKKGKKALVKWFGYPESFNSWVDDDALTQL